MVLFDYDYLFVQISVLTSTSKTSAISVNCGRDG